MNKEEGKQKAEEGRSLHLALFAILDRLGPQRVTAAELRSLVEDNAVLDVKKDGPDAIVISVIRQGRMPCEPL
jgi:hypothetical protein